MKIHFLALAFICLASPAFAQFHIGMSAGPNISFWEWEIKSFGYNLNYDAAMGWRTALLGEWQIAPWIGVRAETGLNTKVNKRISYLVFESDLLAGNFKGSRWIFRENFQYWESSLLVQINPVKRYRWAYLFSGCSSAWLQYAWRRTKGSETGIKHNSREPIDFKAPNWNRNTFSADFGLGANIPLNARGKLKVEGRFQYGLSNLSTSNEVDARVSSLLLNLGYLQRL